MEQATADFVRQGYNTAQIRTIGLTTQRETTVLWDHDTGKPLCRAIAWPDTRTQALVREFRRKSGHEDVQQRTGLPLSTYPSVVKLSWMLRNVPAVQDAYQAGSLSFGTMDSWLLYNLTGKQGHKTDVTNASRTMLLNLHSLEYDEEMLRFFGLDRTKLKLPEVLPCANAFGKLVDGPLEGTTITGCMGDQSAALVGQLAMSTGQAKNTYGTGCFMLYNVGAKPVASSHGLLGTVAYQLGETPVYALEGSIAVAGSAIKFLQHNLGLIEASHEINALAATVKDNGGCVFVTAFSGLFAPYWIDDAQGTIFGITQHTQKGHLARATLEASCFQTKAILEAMQKDSGRRLTELAVDGGMSHSDLCMQVGSPSSSLFCCADCASDPGRHHRHTHPPATDARNHGLGSGHYGRSRDWRVA